MWFSAKYKDGEVRDLELDDYWTKEPIYRLKEQFRSGFRGYPISIKDKTGKEYIHNSSTSTNPVVANALAAKGVAKNGFYKTEEEAEYRAEQFVSAALSRIKGDIDGEIKTVSDCIKLFKGAPMSDKAKSDLERLKAHLAKLNKCKAMF